MLRPPEEVGQLIEICADDLAVLDQILGIHFAVTGLPV
jgi:hypothetical protein